MGTPVLARQDHGGPGSELNTRAMTAMDEERNM